MRRLLLLSCALLLSACSSKVTNIKEDRDTLSKADEGYLLIGIETNRSLKAIYIDGPKSLVLTAKDIRSGSNYILANLPLGDYTITRLNLNRYSYLEFDNDEESWQFTLSAKKINYVGHLDISTIGFWYTRSHIVLENRSSEALQYMEQNFPTILSGRSLNYGGPGEDSFFDYLEQTFSQQEAK
ncbi:hypothetical protein MKZ42_18395 [Pseudoalteromonas shioyasakiensis]|uniref:DUF2846 domain-containing protein n=1 Tax=Pseudoalteromonas shioyasakiensis TaxID=1190813 RepID=A0ABT6U1I4_9GAMM|nr:MULTISPECIES: hypothetical protein [Pseudoalteromonas]MDI4670029.1 hypothetical protein [Pseudoalteromonas shioyasakiensis]MDI4675220.1 hypothetical protein [Pseudoalteromonas shioyasakiensis]MDI4687239.1 hypothetical protein [Pseudoalteromonas shioyasakiensis]MDI4705834.1 hypothetical protein [Pseudoalteromonas shioyasakiensis]NHH88494.1 hypothetical protein [Pseudoalteromonas sp. MB47]